MITSGIKIKTTFITSTPAITAAIGPIPATMANTPKTFSPVRRTDVNYPRTTQLRGRLPWYSEIVVLIGEVINRT
jgi:hypothetical protein